MGGCFMADDTLRRVSVSYSQPYLLADMADKGVSVVWPTSRIGTFGAIYRHYGGAAYHEQTAVVGYGIQVASWLKAGVAAHYMHVGTDDAYYEAQQWLGASAALLAAVGSRVCVTMVAGTRPWAEDSPWRMHVQMAYRPMPQVLTVVEIEKEERMRVRMGMEHGASWDIPKGATLHIYNVTGYNCKCQGLFGLRLRDSAFVNVVFERTKESNFLTQYSGPMENVLFAHVTLVNQTWLWRDDFAPLDVRVVNCCVPSMGAHQSERAFDGSGANGLLVSHCFFTGGKGVFGLDVKSGDPRFADPAARDYSLRPGSPALAAFRPLQCVPADFRGIPFRGASAATPVRPRDAPNRAKP